MGSGPARKRRSTATSNFGVGRRESHDASAFYDRFRSPELSTDDTVARPAAVAEPFVCGDARSMDAVADGSVALVVTSPPYFAGKRYEEELERDGVPSSYAEYLELLHDVLAECKRKLEPGGRIAVNVANLGRKPYRSLSADVIGILQDRLGLLLRGELIWRKAEGASGSCAWGSFRSASNPVLRDVTERVVVASKGRFDRARSASQRATEGLPHESTLMADDFMALTLDLWEIPAESARRIGHPAPFPVELPEQLIRLYTYAGDLVLDPFMGSGSALVAAARLDRRYAGYDLDPDYVELARRRVADALAPPGAGERDRDDGRRAGPSTGSVTRPDRTDGKDRAAPATRDFPSPGSSDADPDRSGDPAPDSGDPARDTADQRDSADLGPDPDDDFRGRATREGKRAQALAEEVLEGAGFTIVGRDRRLARTGVAVSFVAADAAGDAWLFDVSGAFTTHRGGLLRSDAVWKALGRAHALRGVGVTEPLVLLTSHLPARPGEGDTAMRAAGPDAFFDAVEMLSDDGRSRLERYAKGGFTDAPLPGFWTDRDLDRRTGRT